MDGRNCVSTTRRMALPLASGIISARCGETSRRPGPEPVLRSPSRGRLFHRFMLSPMMPLGPEGPAHLAGCSYPLFAEDRWRLTRRISRKTGRPTAKKIEPYRASRVWVARTFPATASMVTMKTSGRTG